MGLHILSDPLRFIFGIFEGFKICFIFNWSGYKILPGGVSE